jgi:hypothetical protein
VVSVRTAPATSATPATMRMDAPTRSVSMSSTVGKSLPGIANAGTCLRGVVLCSWLELQVRCHFMSLRPVCSAPRLSIARRRAGQGCRDHPWARDGVRE